jgi:hypothetical protein
LLAFVTVAVAADETMMSAVRMIKKRRLVFASLRLGFLAEPRVIDGHAIVTVSA